MFVEVYKENDGDEKPGAVNTHSEIIRNHVFNRHRELPQHSLFSFLMMSSLSE